MSTLCWLSSAILIAGQKPFELQPLESGLEESSEAQAGAQADEQGGGLLERERPVEAWETATGGLAQYGIELGLFYTVDLIANVAGGVERRSDFIGNLDLLMLTDMEQLVGWRGATILLYGLGNHGEISDAVGDAQGVSNIEAPATFKLFEAWIDQELFDGSASVRVGLYDLNSEFDVIPAGAIFLNGSHGMGAALGNSGLNGPSTFPVTSLGLRIKASLGDATYLRAVVSDGVPGSPADDKRTQVELDGDDGVLLLGEVGILNLPSEQLNSRIRRYGDALPPEERHYGFFGKLALGVWRYTGSFDDFNAVDASGAPLQVNAGPGVYVLGEQRVYYEDDDPYQGLSTFLRVGLADGQTNAIDGYLGGGLVYRGLLPGRGEDECGFAVAAAHFGAEYRQAAASGQAWEEWEVAFELTYRTRLAPWLSLQPNVQLVANPGGDPSLEDATVVGLRTLISF